MSLILVLVLMNPQHTAITADTDLPYKIYPEKNDPADEAGGRIPPGTVLGRTSNVGKQVGVWDFVEWLYSKKHAKATSTQAAPKK